MPTRAPQTDDISVLQSILDRLDTISVVISRRCLPPGYEFEFNGSGELIVVRTSDGATQVIAF